MLLLCMIKQRRSNRGIQPLIMSLIFNVVLFVLVPLLHLPPDRNNSTGCKTGKGTNNKQCCKTMRSRKLRNVPFTLKVILSCTQNDSNFNLHNGHVLFLISGRSLSLQELKCKDNLSSLAFCSELTNFTYRCLNFTDIVAALLPVQRTNGVDPGFRKGGGSWICVRLRQEGG